MVTKEERRALYLDGLARASAQIPPQMERRSEVVDTFFAMTRQAREDSSEGPASQEVIYSCIDLLSRDGLEKQVVNTSYRLLKDQAVKANVKRGFETAILASFLVTRHARKK